MIETIKEQDLQQAKIHYLDVLKLIQTGEIEDYGRTELVLFIKSLANSGLTLVNFLLDLKKYDSNKGCELGRKSATELN